MTISRSGSNPPETPRELLLKILFSQEDEARAAAVLCTERRCWAEICHESEVWSVAPQLAERFGTLSLSPPAEQWKEFQRTVIAVYARSASRAAKGAKALRHLNLLGVRAAAFKGLASMARLYARPADRSIKDVDILIMEQDVARAVAGLAGLGFVALDGQGLETLEGLVEFLPGFSGNKAIVLQNADGLELDVHWDISVPLLPAKTLLDRSEPLTLYGGLVPVVALTDALVLTARHSIRENLAVDTMCRDLFDVRRACELLAGDALSRDLEESCLHGGLLPLLALTGILHSLDEGVSPVADAFRILTSRAKPAERKAGRQLVDTFWFQVREGKFEKDLVYLSHTRPLRQILAGTWRNWRGYRDLMLAIEDKLDGGTTSIGVRFWRLAVAARRAGPGRLRSLRTLARLRF